MSFGELFILGFDGTTLPDWVRQFERKHGLGGVLLFDYDIRKKTYDRNVQSPEQVRALCAEIAKLPSRPLVCVDQEGGKVRRLKEKLGFAPLPSAQEFNELALDEKIELVEASFSQLAELGIHFNLAPVVDLNTNPENPDIGKVGRSYSADADDVRANVDICNSAAGERGLGLCLKHYPGMGGAKVNSHEELTDLSDVLTSEETELFFELAPDLSGKAILVGHGIVRQWDPVNPVSMSPQGLARLRERLPEILLMSDDLQMMGLQKKYPTDQACERGIRAGLDMVIVGNNLMREEEAMTGIADSLKRLAEDDEAFRERVAEAVEKVRLRKQMFNRR
jgi:beta-N-acetylhexosaminidase